MTFIRKIEKRMQKANSLLCVGLDSNFERLPKRFQNKKYPQFEFNKWVIKQTYQSVCAYKPNIAFYETRGAQGLKELKLTTNYLKDKHPDICLICDAKRADIGSTNQGYVDAIFDELSFDAVTLHPYLGKEALQPFLDRQDKGCIILCRTSNPGAGELQDLEVNGKPVWQVVAEKVTQDWNQHGNCMLVVGATYPSELAAIRKIAKDMTFLVPGIGAQGGDVDKVVAAGLNSQGRGMIINSSRSIIFSKNPGQEAEKVRQQIADAIRSY